MKVLIVFAHPEPQSLSASLRDVAIAALEAAGHEVRVSDLYAMGWKSEIDRADFPSLAPEARLMPAAASRQAFAEGTLTADVQAEIDKLLWADTLILQFPLWWFTMAGHPERLGGPRLRLWLCLRRRRAQRQTLGRPLWRGAACRQARHADRHRRRLAAALRSARRQRPIDDLLFPINHGILYYPGYTVLPPFVTYSADRLDEARFAATADSLRERMRTLETTAPIAYRRQNGGDYLIPSMELRDGLGAAAAGFGLHVRES